jgi:fructokinase
MIRIGVDFGGTKIEAAALDASGAIVARVRRPNPGSYEAALQTVREVVDTVEAEIGERASVGVGMPGSESPRSGLIRGANSVWLNGQDFRAALTQTLDRPVRLANDANCLALSEASDGAAAGAEIVFAVIIGTGCGGGLVVRGQIVGGANGIGGEWGHTPLPWPSPAEFGAPACWCQRPGCMETWVSGPGFENDHRRTTGRSWPVPRIVEAARAGDDGAEAALDRYVDRLGRGLAVIADVLDPEVIVFGGGVSNVPELYDRVRPVMSKWMFSDVCETRLVPALHGDSSGVRGAAWLWPLNP